MRATSAARRSLALSQRLLRGFPRATYLGHLIRSTVESSSHQLFEFNPRMSYVPDEWIKADPDFWKPKTVAATTAKPATEEKKARP